MTRQAFCIAVYVFGVIAVLAAQSPSYTALVAATLFFVALSDPIAQLVRPVIGLGVQALAPEVPDDPETVDDLRRRLLNRDGGDLS